MTFFPHIGSQFGQPILEGTLDFELKQIYSWMIDRKAKGRGKNELISLLGNRVI